MAALASGWRARRARCRRSAPSPCGSSGKWPGTQSSSTPKPGFVEGIDQRDEILRRAEAAGRREQPGRLIAPGAVERMLRDRQQFDMGEAHVGGIGGKLLGEFAIGQPVLAPFSPCAATSRDAPRRSTSARSSALTSSRRGRRARQLVLIDHDRGGGGPHFGGEGDRVGFQAAGARRSRRRSRICICRRRGRRARRFPNSHCRARAWRGAGRPRN